MRRFIKIAIPVVIIIVLVILIRTGFLLNQMKHKLADSLNLKIEQIEGNLFSTITLREVQYENAFYSPRISISYTPLSIIRKSIKKLEIDSALIKAGQFGETFSFPFTVNNFSLRYALLSNIPQIDTLQFLGLKGSFDKGLLKVKKGAVNIRFENADIVGIKVKKISGELLFGDTTIALNQVSIKTANSEFLISGNIKQDYMNFNLNIPQLQIQEFIEDVAGNLSSEIHFVKTAQAFISKGKINLKNGEYGKFPLGDIETCFTLSKDALELKIEKWKLQDAMLAGALFLSLDSLSYNVVLVGEKINLSTLYPPLCSNLNGEVKIQGKGKNFSSTLDLTGTIKDIKLQSIKSVISKTNAGLELLSFKGRYKSGEIKANGIIAPEKLQLSISGKKVSLETFTPIISGISNFDFILQGTLKDPAILGTFYVKDLKLSEIKGDYCSGNIDVKNLLSLTGEAQLDVVNLSIYKNKVNTLNALLYAHQGEAEYKISAQDKSANIILSGKGKKNTFSIDTLLLRFPDLELSSSEPAEFELKQGQLKLKQWNLLINKSLVQLKGLISKNILDFSILTPELDLNHFSKDFNGTFYLRSTIKGNLQNPCASFVSRITDFSYKTIKAEKIFLAGLYKNQKLFVEKGEFINKKELIQLSGTIPFIPPFMFPDELIDLKLTLSNFRGANLYPLSPFLGFNKTKINTRLKIKGTCKFPFIYGKLALSGEDMSLKFIGAKLLKPIAKLDFQGDKINISSFQAKTKNGSLKFKGYMSLQDELVDIQLIAKKLPIEIAQDAKAELSTTLSIKGNFKSPKVQGDIKVESALITAPFTQTKTVNVQYPIDYDLTIDFPEKIWLKNPQLDAEFSGKVEVRKFGQDFSLAGNAEVKEGFFHYYHIPFKIEQGEVKFKNSPELDPDVNLLASTIVHYTIERMDTLGEPISVDTSCVVKLNVGGSIKKLDFTLSSEPQMPLQDIMTLLSFNMKFEDIMELQNLKYQQTGTKIVSWYFFNKSGVLEELKNIMDVDVFRVDPDLLASQRKMKFNVGKHFFEDLYISYTNDLFAPSSHQFKARYSPWKYGSIIGEREEKGEFKTGIMLKIRY